MKVAAFDVAKNNNTGARIKILSFCVFRLFGLQEERKLQMITHGSWCISSDWTPSLTSEERVHADIVVEQVKDDYSRQLVYLIRLDTKPYL